MWRIGCCFLWMWSLRKLPSLPKTLQNPKLAPHVFPSARHGVACATRAALRHFNPDYGEEGPFRRARVCHVLPLCSPQQGRGQAGLSHRHTQHGTKIVKGHHPLLFFFPLTRLCKSPPCFPIKRQSPNSRGTPDDDPCAATHCVKTAALSK